MPNHQSVKPVERARKFLTRYQVTGYPTPLESLAKRAGAQLRFQPLDGELSGMIFIKNDVPIIGINSLHHPNRQRFTIAHELGHLDMHREMITAEVHVDKNFPGLMRDTVSASGTELIEIQANQFAAELLMPRDVLEAEIAKKDFDIDDEKPIEELAKKFRVSKQALLYRIRNRNVA